LFATLLNSNLSFGQIQIRPDNTQSYCPGELVHYDGIYIGDSLGYVYKYKWTVINGVIPSAANASIIETYNPYVDVIWNNTTSDAFIKVEYRLSGHSYYSNRIDTLKIPIRSINGITPGAISGPSTIIFGVTQNTFSCPTLYYPNKGTGESDIAVTSYSWLIPLGWKLNGEISDGVTKFEGKSRSVNIETDNTSSGTIKVWGYSDCGTGYHSNERSINVTRTFPAITIAASGNNTYLQGDKSPITFSVPNYSYATYLWTKTGSWTLQGSNTTNSATFIPDGCNGSTISCKITIPATGQNTTITKTIIAFNPYAENAVPYISGASQVCTSAGLFSVGNIPPYTSSYNWISNNYTQIVSGQGTSSIYLKATTSGAFTQNLEISVGGCTPFTISKNLWAGEPQFTLEGDQTLMTNDYGIANLHYTGGSINTVNWTKSGAIASITGTLAVGKYKAARTEGIGYIYANATNVCGTVQKSLRVEVTDMFALVYPNPTDNEITVEMETESYVENNTTLSIYDQNNVLKQKETMQSTVKTIPLNNLKTGTYWVELNNSKKAERKQFIVK